MPGKGRKLLIVEDELLMQRLLQTELSSLNFRVETASSVVEAKRVIDRFDPDIALIDISLKGGLNGLHLGSMLTASYPEIVQVYLTKHEDVQSAATSGLEIPANAGFVSKHLIGSSDYLIDEIDRVALRHGAADRDQRTSNQAMATLGVKGQRVLQLLADGYSNQYIAKEIGVTPKAVEYYTESIYRELGIVKSADRNPRVDAAVRYQRELFARGLSTEPDSSRRQ